MTSSIQRHQSALKEGRAKTREAQRSSPEARVEMAEGRSISTRHTYSPWLLAGAAVTAVLLWVTRFFSDEV